MSFDTLLAHVEAARTLRRTPRPLPDRLERLVIVGASCAGKTTLARAVGESAAAAEGRIVIPIRFTTRPRRLNDCERENRHVDEAAFEQLVEAGAIATHWRRALGAGRIVRYGFPATPPGVLAVLPGNNALLRSPEVLTPGVVVISVIAPVEVCEARLRRRSPDLVAERPDEVQLRLGPAPAGVADCAHIVVANHGDGEPHAPGEVRRLVELAAELGAIRAR